jgi:hypothetical protein
MSAPQTRSSPPSIPVEPGVLNRTVELLDRVEALPPHAVGALRFGAQGIVLVESRAVCFAAAAGMQHRFTQLLRYQHNPPLERGYLIDLYRQCKDGQAPLVEALLATGTVSPAALRTTLYRHNAEAIARIALSGARCEAFVPRVRYQPRFTFSTVELLACLGARSDPALAVAAQRELDQLLVPETSGWAFLRDDGRGAPIVVAVRGSAPLRCAELLEVCTWAASLFDVTSVFDDEVAVASASFSGGRYVVAWRSRGTYYAATSANRAGSARLLAALDARMLSGSREGR